MDGDTEHFGYFKRVASVVLIGIHLLLVETLMQAVMRKLQHKNRLRWNV